MKSRNEAEPPLRNPPPRRDEPLRHSEERFRLLVEQVKDYAIFMLDPEGYIVSWNVGAERIKGYKPSEIIGQHFSRFYLPDALERGWPGEELRLAQEQGRFENEGWRVRKDGTTFWANVIITPLYEGGKLQGFAKVTRDMTDRKRIRDLEAAERGTQEFLAMLAHELRSPLAPIRNALGVLRSDAGEKDKQWCAEVIERQVGHLTRLVDDLLDVSRVTSGTITLVKEAVELAAITARAVEGSSPHIEMRRQHLEVDLPDEPLWVKGDLVRLSQVVLNLLNNSAKYTPVGGRIDMSVCADGGDVIIRVRDMGMGIPADLLPKIFDLFRQGARTLDRSEGGLGLGLTLVRRIVEMHGGSVEARSAGPGQGSEFTLRLPRLVDPRVGTLEPSIHESKPLSHGVPHRVLVVDDSADTARTIAMLLELWGQEVRVADDGPSALAIAGEFYPDIVLLDIGLPGMSGYEVAKRLREIPGLARATVLAVTGYGQEGDRMRAFDGGFDRHFVKPLEPAALKRVLDTAPRTPPRPQPGGESRPGPMQETTEG